MAFPGLKNYTVPIPGTTVTAYLAVASASPETWMYSLWNGKGDDEELISQGEFNLTGLDVTPEQVARIAFLMDLEYGS